MSERRADPVDPLAGKAEWERRRDTHGRQFPDSLRNWLSLDPIWTAKSDAIEAAFLAVGEGHPPDRGAFDDVRPLMLEVVDADWTIDEPVVREELPTTLEWMLLYRDADQMTAMTLDADGYFDRMFWETALAGDPIAFVVGFEPAPIASKKHLPEQ